MGLTENPAALQRWMVCGSEMARLLQQFERETEKKQSTDERHHDQKKHVQISFQEDVRSLSKTIKEMGNPFSDCSSDLLVLNSRDVMDTTVADTVGRILEIGIEQYEDYVEKRLVNQIIPISNAIKRNNLPLFPPSTN